MTEPAAPSGGAERGGKLKRLRRSQPEPVAAPEAPPVATDAITGLPTRAFLPGALAQAIDESSRDSTIAVLAFVEAGALRDLNDTVGPDVVDQVLRLAGQRLQAIDVPGAQVVRYEGAVFGVVIPQVPNLAGAETAAAFLVEYMSDPFVVGTDVVRIAPIVGAAISTDNYERLDDMVRDAFHSLAQARDAGYGAYVVHDETKRTRYSTRIDDRRLQDAIANDEFELFHQPIMRLDSSELVGVEALIRWRQPGTTNIGILYPHDFLPLLEKSGRIIDVGRWVLDTSCRQVAAWERDAPEAPKLFITCNVGPHELADPKLPDAVMAAISNAGIQPWQVCLDITEEALRYNRFQRDIVWAGLRSLNDQGVKLGLDDFGTGVASLSVLREMRVDLLRIDRLFVAGLGVAAEDSAIVKHVGALARDLGCMSVAEGVETVEQEASLRNLGIDLGQGFLYGRPETSEQVAERLRPGSTKNTNWDASNVLPG